MFKHIYMDIIMIHKILFQWEKCIVILLLLSKNNKAAIVQKEDINPSLILFIAIPLWHI